MEKLEFCREEVFVGNHKGDDLKLQNGFNGNHMDPEEEEEENLDGLSGVDEKTRRLAKSFADIIDEIGEDKNREGLRRTPLRCAQAIQFFTKGYNESLQKVVNGAIFNMDPGHDDMIVVKDIEIYSLCEHHMVPFFGKVHIGYIPKDKVLGLSKLARIAEMFARRLQIQERLTRDIADAIAEVIHPTGVAVVCECVHMCMVMRGAQKPGSRTTTSAMVGVFREDHKSRQEFFAHLKK
jgi:GTP cyclohydrolase I